MFLQKQNKLEIVFEGVIPNERAPMCAFCAVLLVIFVQRGVNKLLLLLVVALGDVIYFVPGGVKSTAYALSRREREREMFIVLP